MSGVELDHVSIRFGDFLAIDDCHLTIEKGEFFRFLRPSGCGKTTILRAVYDFEVALHCGLVDQRLARAYHGARTPRVWIGLFLVVVIATGCHRESNGNHYYLKCP